MVYQSAFPEAQSADRGDSCAAAEGDSSPSPLGVQGDIRAVPGLVPARAYKSFKPTLKTTQKKVIYLTKEEMGRIRNLQLSEAQAYLDPIRDVFLFCCFSGLRHSDANNLRKSDIKGDHTGRRTFIVTTLSLGIPPNVVMKWTGHSDYSSMKPYIDIVDDIKATSMTKLNGLL